MSVVKPAASVLCAAIVCAGAGCDRPDPAGHRSVDPELRRTEDAEPANPVVWGCEKSIPELPDRAPARWRKRSIVVGDFGFYSMKGNVSGFRPHRRADIQVKLPVLAEGGPATTVWVPPSERDRVGLILGDVERRGPGNSYRVEDGHQAVRFEPCEAQAYTAWTAGLALADRSEVVVMVEPDGRRRPQRVRLGPWEVPDRR